MLIAQRWKHLHLFNFQQRSDLIRFNISTFQHCCGRFMYAYYDIPDRCCRICRTWIVWLCSFSPPIGLPRTPICTWPEQTPMPSTIKFSNRLTHPLSNFLSPFWNRMKDGERSRKRLQNQINIRHYFFIYFQFPNMFFFSSIINIPNH